MINLDESIVAVWYMQLDEVSDWLGSLSHMREPNKEGKKHDFVLTYRFRYYDGPGIFEASKDEKSWDNGYFDGTKEDVLEKVRRTIQLLSYIADAPKMYEIVNDDDFDKFMEGFAQMPFVHMKMIKPADA